MICKMRKDCWRIPLVVVCQLLILQSALGQQPNAQRGLRVMVVEGEGARNVVQQIASRPLIVRVVDATNRPVAGATVVFTAPESRAGGEFENDSSSVRVMTDQDGKAAAGVYHPNATTGSYQIRVTAEFQGQTGTAVIRQTNIAEKTGHGKLIATIAIAAAAAGAAVAYRNRRLPPNAPTIIFGGAAVGAPR